MLDIENDYLIYDDIRGAAIYISVADSLAVPLIGKSYSWGLSQREVEQSKGAYTTNDQKIVIPVNAVPGIVPMIGDVYYYTDSGRTVEYVILEITLTAFRTKYQMIGRELWINERQRSNVVILEREWTRTPSGGVQYRYQVVDPSPIAYVTASTRMTDQQDQYRDRTASYVAYIKNPKRLDVGMVLQWDQKKLRITKLTDIQSVTNVWVAECHEESR